MPPTLQDLPDPYENPAAWFSGLAMLPSADGGSSLAERLAIHGGSLWWLVDYWCYEGGYTGVSLPNLLKGMAVPGGVWKRRLLDTGKRWRERVRSVADRGHYDRDGEIILVSQSSYRGEYRIADGARKGDIHLGPVRDEIIRRGLPHVIIERDTKRSLMLRHPWTEPDLVPAHRLLASTSIEAYVKALKNWQPPDNMDATVRCWLNSVLHHLIKGRLQEAAAWYYGVVYWLRGHPAKWLVLADEADMFGRAFLTASRVLAIRSVAVQHGILYRGHYGYTNHPLCRTGSSQMPFADVTCVHGQRYTEYLLNDGCYHEDELRLVGNPRFDFVRKSCGDTERKAVVVATQPLSEGLRKKIFAVGLRAAKILQEPLVIKLHPGDRMGGWYQSQLGTASGSRVVREADLLTVLGGARLLVTGNSTVVLEAARLGCDTLCVQDPLLADPLGYVDSGAALAVDSEDVLDALLPLSAPNRKALAMGRRELVKMYLIDSSHAAADIVDAGLSVTREVV